MGTPTTGDENGAKNSRTRGDKIKCQKIKTIEKGGFHPQDCSSPLPLPRLLLHQLRLLHDLRYWDLGWDHRPRRREGARPTSWFLCWFVLTSFDIVRVRSQLNPTTTTTTKQTAGLFSASGVPDAMRPFFFFSFLPMILYGQRGLLSSLDVLQYSTSR